jgi:hypothetical protein
VTRWDAALLRQEVQELTDLLRSGHNWETLRVALKSQGLRPVDVLLISFQEDETGGEYGAFVRVRDRAIFEYQRSTDPAAQGVFFLWRERAPGAAVIGEYPQLVEALRMLDEGVIQ